MGRRGARRPGSLAAALSAAVALAAGAAVLPLSAALAAPVAAPETFVAGTGTSSSSIARVSLRSAGLAIGVGFGQARTRFAGAQGNAEAESVDLGLLGTLAKAPIACGIAPDSLFPAGSMPTGVAVSSGGGPAEARTASVGAGTPVELGTQYGRATPNSTADAAVTGARLDLAGIVTAAGGTASSAAKLTPGTQREAAASSGLGTLTLAGGLVALEDLRWGAAHRTGAEQDSTAGFSVGAITVAGQRLPTSGATELAEAFAAANQALALTGLTLDPPAVTSTAQGISVSALRLTVSATPELRAALAPALAAVQPARSQLLELVTPFQASPDCGFAKALGFGYLVADLALVVLGDDGGIDLDLGGARAGTESLSFANPFAVGLDPLTPGAAIPGADIPAAEIPGVTLPGNPLTPGPATPGGTPPAAASSPGLSPPGPGGDAQPSTVAAAGLPSAQLAPVSIACRSTHDEGDGCAGRHGELAAWIVLCLIVALAAADRWRSLRS